MAPYHTAGAPILRAAPFISYWLTPSQGPLSSPGIWLTKSLGTSSLGAPLFSFPIFFSRWGPFLGGLVRLSYRNVRLAEARLSLSSLFFLLWYNRCVANQRIASLVFVFFYLDAQQCWRIASVVLIRYAIKAKALPGLRLYSYYAKSSIATLRAVRFSVSALRASSLKLLYPYLVL